MSRSDRGPIRFGRMVIDGWRVFSRGPLPYQTVEIKVLQERGRPHMVQVSCSPTGRKVRVFLDGKELR